MLVIVVLWIGKVVMAPVFQVVKPLGLSFSLCVNDSARGDMYWRL